VIEFSIVLFTPRKRDSKGENVPDSRNVEVNAIWDDEAGVWVAESEDVPGLVTEAETMEALMEKLRVLVPELMELSGSAEKTANIHLRSDRTILVQV
jgi:hypothetical protein